MTQIVGSISKDPRVKEIEKHLHNREFWLGAQAVPVGTVNVADDMTDGTTAPFTPDAGNDTWGAWLQIVGSGDTPLQSGKTKYDLHRLLPFDDQEANAPTFIQIAWGNVDAATALAAGDYSTTAYLTPTNQGASAPVEVLMPRIDVGKMAWIRIMAIGENTMNLSFYIGLHEYDG